MQSNSVLCLLISAFLIVDSTFHSHWHVFGVRHQEPCSGKFACLGNRPTLANGTDAEVRLQKLGATTVLPSGACHLAQMNLYLYSKCGCARITTLGLLPHCLEWS